MTTQDLSAIAGVIVSLAFSYIPGLSTWFAALGVEQRRAIMLGLVVVVASVIFGLACWQTVLVELGVTCDVTGAMDLGKAIVAFAVANQITYKLSPQLKSVRLLKNKV